MKKIAYLATGGTISTVKTKDGALPIYSASKLFERLQLPTYFDVTERDIFRQSSRNISVFDMITLAREVERCADEGFDGVVITHGTDTLEETTYALYLLTSRRIPVIVTGAMISPDALGSDALLNLTNAFIAAGNSSLGGYGPLVCFAGQLHLAQYAYKFSSTSVDAFRSSHTGPIGTVQEGQLKLLLEEGYKPDRFSADPFVKDRVDALFTRCELGPDSDSTAGGVTPFNGLLDEVGIVVAYAGMGAEMIEASSGLFRGLVLAGTGGGHLSAEAATAAVELVDDGFPVVLASRCADGTVLTNTYGGLGSEKHLLGAGLLNADTLSPVKARLRLMLGLNMGLSPSEIFSSETEHALMSR